MSFIINYKLFLFQAAFQEFTVCLQALVDPMKLQQEIEEAKPNGQVDEVFKK
jgi:hypothetical protein